MIARSMVMRSNRHIHLTCDCDKLNLKMSETSYRLDETCVKVGKEWKYLYHAIDSTGQTSEFMLRARRDVSAAKRFCKQIMRAAHRRLPFTVGTDKHASYPQVFAASVQEKVLPSDCKLRRVKYLNNVTSARPPRAPQEVEGHAMRPLVPYRRTDDRRC
jgi:transposase-like protein